MIGLLQLLDLVHDEGAATVSLVVDNGNARVDFDPGRHVDQLRQDFEQSSLARAFYWTCYPEIREVEKRLIYIGGDHPDGDEKVNPIFLDKNESPKRVLDQGNQVPSQHSLRQNFFGYLRLGCLLLCLPVLGRL